MATISLCLIVGNVEEYIDRCLTSFKPIADEICVVRAIGNQAPDKTVEIAVQKFGARFKEYKNKPGHEDWPHVDDFAAARQMSFDMAQGDYCFWCDSDDVLESGADIIRELANRGGYAAYVFPYRIFGRGVNVPRERMVTKSAGRWRYPVHECFDFHIQPVRAVEDQRVVVTHMPHFSKTGSNERNIRILKSVPQSEMTAGLWYHLQGELAGSGDIQGSIEAAKKALACEDLGRAERLELFLNLARMAESPETKNDFLLQAYKADPRRREPLGLLTCNALDCGKNDLALAYARQMMATLPPEKTEWNQRKDAYSWLGDEIYTQALRANGFRSEAEIIRRESLKRAGGAAIALVHATRGRPVEASRARKLWLDLAENPQQIEHIFAIDDDDRESDPLRRMHHIVVPGTGGGCVAAWNYGCLATVAPVIIQLSDDWTPMPRWDQLIIDRLGDLNKPSVLAVSDGIRHDDLLCMAICTRAYFGLDYFLFHPWFTGVYSDNWFTEVAYKRGAVIQARDLVFTHNHPLASGKPMDRTYAEQNSQARYAEGQAILDTLLRGNDWSTVPGWFDFWDFYDSVARRLKDGDTVAEIGVWQGRSIIYLAQRLQRMGKNVRIIAVDNFSGNQSLEQGTRPLINLTRLEKLEDTQIENSIDPKKNRQTFEDNIKRCGVSDLIEIIEGDSATVASQIPDSSLAFCFLDGGHDYCSVERDITAWKPKVKAAGAFAGHDAHSPGVSAALKSTGIKVKLVGNLWINI